MPGTHWDLRQANMRLPSRWLFIHLTISLVNSFPSFLVSVLQAAQGLFHDVLPDVYVLSEHLVWEKGLRKEPEKAMFKS